MTLEEYEKFVDNGFYTGKGIEQLIEDREATINFLRLGYISGKMNGEAGEFVEEVQKSLRDSGGDIGPRLDNMLDELGDVLWYVTCAALELGVDLEFIMKRNKEKLVKRHGDREEL